MFSCLFSNFYSNWQMHKSPLLSRYSEKYCVIQQSSNLFGWSFFFFFFWYDSKCIQHLLLAVCLVAMRFDSFIAVIVDVLLGPKNNVNKNKFKAFITDINRMVCVFELFQIEQMQREIWCCSSFQMISDQWRALFTPILTLFCCVFRMAAE